MILLDAGAPASSREEIVRMLMERLESKQLDYKLLTFKSLEKRDFMTCFMIKYSYF